MLAVHPNPATQWRDCVPAGVVVTQEERQVAESLELGVPRGPGHVPCPVSSRLDRLQSAPALSDCHLPSDLTHLSPRLQGENGVLG